MAGFSRERRGRNWRIQPGLDVVRSELQAFKQPDLDWYFDTAATSPENRRRVLDAVHGASDHVRAALRLGVEDGRIVWWWQRLTLLAEKRHAIARPGAI
jgi:hypothetical protein